MIRAVIADDEAWVRSLLRNMIDWKLLGIQVVGEAESGTGALEMCMAKRPDILVTDVKMPGLDGLELIQKLKERLPELETIVISGYDDFSYAQRALREAVRDYVLKPINKKQIESVLLKAVESIAERRRREARFRAVAEKVKKLEASVTRGTGRPDFPEGVPEGLPEGVDERIARACAYLQEHYWENPSLRRTSGLCFMNPTYFSEVFKKEAGCGYANYLLDIKMRKACIFLERSELKIGEIAESLGYPDPTYFARVFKKRFGRTPEEYRAGAKPDRGAGAAGIADETAE